MSRYIDADLIEWIGCDNEGVTCRPYNGNCDICPHARCSGYQIKKIPTAEVKPIIYGEWEKKGLYMVCCSNCGHELNHEIGKTNFCPMCGADMRKEQNNE